MANIRYKVGDTWYDVGSMGGSISEITVDSQLSDTSANPVENRVITNKLNELSTSKIGINTYATQTQYGIAKIWKDSDNYLCIRTDGN